VISSQCIAAMSLEFCQLTTWQVLPKRFVYKLVTKLCSLSLIQPHDFSFHLVTVWICSIWERHFRKETIE